MSERYTFDEIKEKFIRYRELKRSQLTDEEYGFFCDVLFILPREIVDRLDEDAEFILLSAGDPRAINSACMVPLDDPDFKDKKSLIVLTPIIFGFGIDWNKHDDDQRWAVLHEVAHFHLGTRPYENPEDLQRKEKEADDLAQKWIDDFTNEDPSGEPAEAGSATAPAGKGDHK